MAKNRLDFQARLSRHPHDVSAGYTCSMTTGQIIPMYFDVLGPGDSVYYNTHLFARLQDVVTAFLGEIDIHVDYFFVPLQMIYTPFGQVFAQTNDVLSSTLKGLNLTDNFPVFKPQLLGQGTLNNFYYGHTECYGKELARLYDAFDMNPLTVLHQQLAVPDYPKPAGSVDDIFCMNHSISPWIPAAYQAIYQKYFRNDEFERFSIQDYNIDQYYLNTVFENDRLMKLRYCQRPIDYFQQVRVSPIASAVNNIGNSSVTTDSSAFPENGAGLGNLLNKVNDFLGYSTANKYLGQQFGESSDPGFYSHVAFSSSTNETVSTETFSDRVLLSAANIRALFAIDKFTRIYGRAGKTYDDQILAHFGVKIPHDVKHDLTHLKHYHAALMTDPVYSTSTSGSENGSVLGQVGGQGSVTINSQSQEKFTAPVHGVFMAVAYAVTKPRYFGTFSKLHSLWTRLAFPIPEYDKLGAQPMYAYESNPKYLLAPDIESADAGESLSTSTLTFGSSTLNADSLTPGQGSPDPICDMMVGWQNRYAQFKKRYNRISLNYASPLLFNQASSTNVFSPWVLSRLPYEGNYQLNYDTRENKLVPASQMFESAHALDGVMAVPFNGNWSVSYYQSPHLMFNTDPLIVEFMADVKKVSWMSETGEPDL